MQILKITRVFNVEEFTMPFESSAHAALFVKELFTTDRPGSNFPSKIYVSEVGEKKPYFIVYNHHSTGEIARTLDRLFSEVSHRFVIRKEYKNGVSRAHSTLVTGFSNFLYKVKQPFRDDNRVREVTVRACGATREFEVKIWPGSTDTTVVRAFLATYMQPTQDRLEEPTGQTYSDGENTLVNGLTYQLNSTLKDNKMPSRDSLPRRFSCYGDEFIRVDPVDSLMESGLMQSVTAKRWDTFAVNLRTGALTILSYNTLRKEGLIPVAPVTVRLEELYIAQDRKGRVFESEVENEGDLRKTVIGFSNMARTGQIIIKLIQHGIVCQSFQVTPRELSFQAGSYEIVLNGFKKLHSEG